MQLNEPDKAKIAAVTDLIEQAGELLEQHPLPECALRNLQEELREQTGDRTLDVRTFRQFWESGSAELFARSLLAEKPDTANVTEDDIREAVLTLPDRDEAEQNTVLAWLEEVTGLSNVSDYIFWPEEAGLSPDAELPEIAERIIADSNY